MSSARQAIRERAKAYIQAHPDESKQQQAKATGVAPATVARIRAELIREGTGVPSRKAADVGTPAREPTPASPEKPSGMLDHQAMTAMADMIDAADGPDLDDAETRRRLLRQCLRFAFDPKLHPDTRMSASQMWAKLKEQTKARDLGPGKPMTLEAAVERMRDLMVACGPEIVMAAVTAAFDVKDKEPDDGPKADQQAPAPGGATEAPRPA